MAKDTNSSDGGDRKEPAAATGRRAQADSSEPRKTVPAQVGERPRRYIVAPRARPGQFAPMAVVDSLHTTLENMGLPIIRRLAPRGFSPMSNSGVGHAVVTEMPVAQGEALRAMPSSDFIVEHDQPLQHHGAPFLTARAVPDFAMFSAPPASAAVPVRIKVVDKSGKPAVGATVTIYGQAFPAHGDTDDRGAVEISVGGGLTGLQALYVKPRADFWEKVLLRPQLDADQPNVITLERFAESFAEFPKQKMMGWGQKLMGLDQLGGRFDGAGVKIGIMDSGCDNTHPQLTHVLKGEDLVARDGGTGWTNDTMSHGTHCAGIIGGRSEGVGGICGFAPAAEIHALKVFPSGRISDLIDALDIAVERGLDVLNMSLGSAEPSELVQQKVEHAVSSGVACIVAAGNSSGPVQFPGQLPQSITISAVGQAGQFPADTYHAMTVGPGGPGADGIFAAKFSCFGPQVRLTAPGVAIISTVPDKGYAAWDGTSMATPHVTGLAALVLAHHPAFKANAARDSNRVTTLFGILQASARAVLADPLRGGSGLPFAPAALAAAMAAPEPVAPTPAAPAAAPANPQPASGPPNVVQPAGHGMQVPPELVAQLQLRAAWGDPVAFRLLMLLSGGRM